MKETHRHTAAEVLGTRKTLDELLAEDMERQTKPRRTTPTTYIGDLIAEDEEKAMAKYRAERAAEDAEWNALPQAEKDRRIAELHARFADTGDGEEE